MDDLVAREMQEARDRSYVDAELTGARTSVRTALIKLRRLIDSEELGNDRERLHTVRGVLSRLSNVERELSEL